MGTVRGRAVQPEHHVRKAVLEQRQVTQVVLEELHGTLHAYALLLEL